MDWAWICYLVTLMQIPIFIAGEKLELNVTFDIWEGNVTVLWDPPEGAPVPALYTIKQALYYEPFSERDIVPECNMITETKCDLGNFVFKPEMKIKVELVNENGLSWSAIRRIRLYETKLLYPEFDLSSTSNMVKVKIHRKPFLKQLFEYGPRYTAILYPKGQESQALIVSDDDDEDGEVEFTSLSLWQEYCVCVKVEFTSNDASNTSLPRCIYPSTDLSMVISIAVIGVVGVMFFFVFLVCFFLRRPRKMPAVLKSAVNGWHPMTVGLTQVETVTDKGWLLTNNQMEVEVKAFGEEKDLSEEDKERRESTDSGVSIGQQNSVKNRDTSGDTADEDSGCSSLTGTEDSLSGGRRSLEELPILNGGVNSSSGERKEDSGLGMGHQDLSDNLSSGDGDVLSEIVIVRDGYRTQSPSADAESEDTILYDKDTKMADPTDGYRSGHVTCLCSDFETCMWCKTRKLLTDRDSLSQEQTNCTFTTDNDNDRPSYLQKTPLETLNVSGTGDLSSWSDENCSESSLFITCPLLLQEPCKLDTLPLTLGDVELTFT